MKSSGSPEKGNIYPSLLSDLIKGREKAEMEARMERGRQIEEEIRARERADEERRMRAQKEIEAKIRAEQARIAELLIPFTHSRREGSATEFYYKGRDGRSYDSYEAMRAADKEYIRSLGGFRDQTDLESLMVRPLHRIREREFPWRGDLVRFDPVTPVDLPRRRPLI